MNAWKSYLTCLVLLAFVASGCGKTQTVVAPGDTNVAETAPPMDLAPKLQGKGLDANVVQQQISGDTPTQAEAVAAAPLTNAAPAQALDARLQDMLRNFRATGDRAQRSGIATEMRKLADAGVPKPQIASALGDLFRDENSADVKVDIMNELGNLEDPSAYDQIVAGLDQRQPDEVHVAALEELDSLGDKRAVPLIQPFLTDRDEDVRDAARSAIDSLNDQ